MGFLGKQDSNFILGFKQKLKNLYPHENLFQTSQNLVSIITDCVQNLSISGNLQQTTNELIEKLTKTSLNDAVHSTNDNKHWKW